MSDVVLLAAARHSAGRLSPTRLAHPVIADDPRRSGPRGRRRSFGRCASDSAVLVPERTVNVHAPASGSALQQPLNSPQHGRDGPDVTRRPLQCALGVSLDGVPDFSSTGPRRSLASGRLLRAVFVVTLESVICCRAPVMSASAEKRMYLQIRSPSAWPPTLAGSQGHPVSALGRPVALRRLETSILRSSVQVASITVRRTARGSGPLAPRVWRGSPS